MEQYKKSVNRRVNRTQRATPLTTTTPTSNKDCEYDKKQKHGKQRKQRQWILAQMKSCLYAVCAISLISHLYMNQANFGCSSTGSSSSSSQTLENLPSRRVEQQQHQQQQQQKGHFLNIINNNKSTNLIMEQAGYNIRAPRMLRYCNNDGQLSVEVISWIADSSIIKEEEQEEKDAVISLDQSKDKQQQRANPHATILSTVRKRMGKTTTTKEDTIGAVSNTNDNNNNNKKDNDDSCIPQHEWQTQSFPTCNTFHEQDMTLLGVRPGSKEYIDNGTRSKRRRIKYIACGGFRDVFKLYSDETCTGEPVVLKTLGYEKEFTKYIHDRHRRDAVANGQITSPYVAWIYGSCGNSGLYEYAPGGSLEDILREWTFNSTEKLILGYHVAAAVRDVHNNNAASRRAAVAMTHTDIKPEQYIYVPNDGVVKLTDFNRCQFLYWNKRSNTTCPFHLERNLGKYRAPEEYKFEAETEKVDVYQMGNVLYTILTNRWPFEEDTSTKAIHLIKKGLQPVIEEQYKTSQDPAEQALLQAIFMSWIYNPEERASSREVTDHLYSVLKQLGLDERIYF